MNARMRRVNDYPYGRLNLPAQREKGNSRECVNHCGRTGCKARSLKTTKSTMKRERFIKRGEKGVAAIEFGLVLPILLLFIFGIIEFSTLLYDKAMITNASREGARAGVVYRPDHLTLTEAEIADVVNAFGKAHVVTFGEHNPPVIEAKYIQLDEDGEEIKTPVDVARAAGIIKSGDRLEVKVDFTYGFLILPPLFELFDETFREALTITATTVMRYE